MICTVPRDEQKVTFLPYLVFQYIQYDVNKISLIYQIRKVLKFL